MGPPKVELPSPDKYLKKHSKHPKPPESKSVYQTVWGFTVGVWIWRLHFLLGQSLKMDIRLGPAQWRSQWSLGGLRNHWWGSKPKGISYRLLSCFPWSLKPLLLTQRKDTNSSWRTLDLSLNTSWKRYFLWREKAFWDYFLSIFSFILSLNFVYFL